MPKLNNANSQTRVLCYKMFQRGMSRAQISEQLKVEISSVRKYIASPLNKILCDECGDIAVYQDSKRTLCRSCLCPDEPAQLNPWSGVSCTCCT